MTVEFNTTEKSQLIMSPIGKAFEEVAFAQADEFISAGQSIPEATSIVAHFMVRAAWIAAGCGAVSDGREPDKDRFRSMVENVFESIEFNPIDPSQA